MDKGHILKLFVQARRRAESGDLGITDQHDVINELETRGLSSATARALLAKLITAQEVDLAEMERLLDEMDGGSD